MKNHLILRLMLGGSFLALLIYLFHPSVGQFNIVINGVPIDSSFANFAAVPTFLLVLLVSALLSLLLFIGLSIALFLPALLIASLAIFLIAPYFWPMWTIILVCILIISIGYKHDKSS